VIALYIPDLIHKNSNFGLTLLTHFFHSSCGVLHRLYLTSSGKVRPKFGFLLIEIEIYNAITASTYEIKRDDELILQLADRWCSKTNTFVFPWRESTITLEDTQVSILLVEFSTHCT